MTTQDKTYHVEARDILEHAECIHSEQAISDAVNKMAREISEDLKDKDPIVLCVMNGGLVPSGMLLSRCTFPLRLDYLHATRYGNETEGTELIWQRVQTLSLENETVLIIDDILDEGHTLDAIVQYCHANGAAQVLSAVLVIKDRQRDIEISADYVALSVPDRYVFGCGMDYKGYWRNLPAIYATAEE